jgi:uncharacterized membrane protein
LALYALEEKYMPELIYDLSAVFCFFAIGVMFIFFYYEKLPSKMQKAFNSVFPWSKKAAGILGLVMIFNAANYGYDAFL